ncbi:MAG: hypothetical protein ACNI3A_20115 [Desulfovibrio sp.]|uniref:hypothetical protein n=1 Tax=Desulfovibrio sp. 7SRBS1 TaxID=3378064 RepID=UPI003B3EBE59
MQKLKQPLKKMSRFGYVGCFANSIASRNSGVSYKYDHCHLLLKVKNADKDLELSKINKILAKK